MAAAQKPTELRPPPHDEQAELIVAGAILDGQVDVLSRAGLKPSHFYSNAYRWIWTAALSLTLLGTPVDVESVGRWLRENGRMSDVGGAEALGLLAFAPTRIGPNLVPEIATVIEMARAREAISAFDVYAARIRAEPREFPHLFGLAQQALTDIGSSARRTSAFEPMPASFITEPDEKINWLVEELSICAGPPVMLAGYGYSGKTAAAQALAVAVASGTRAFGWFNCRQGKTLHADYEQGLGLTKRRYRRLALAAGIDVREIANNLGYLSYPPMFLDDPAAELELCRATEGVSLFIADSLKACAPSLDENGSDIRRPLDMLARVSEKTGCVCLIIHHARKPSKDDPPGSRYAIRGNSAIFDACGNVIVLDGKKDDAKLVVHHKERQRGRTHDDFYIDVQDVEVEGDPKAGLRVAAKTAESTKPKRLDKVTSMHEPVMHVVREALKKGAPLENRNAICARIVGASKQVKLEAIKELLREGRIIEDGGVFKMGKD